MPLTFKKVSPVAAVIDNPPTRSRQFLADVAQAIREVNGVAYATEAHNDEQLRWNVFLTAGAGDDARKTVIRDLRRALEPVIADVED